MRQSSPAIGDLVARLHHHVLGLAVQLRVCRLEALHLFPLFNARPVIDEVRDRDPLGQLRSPPT